jgi:hypothetical protein
MTAASKLVWVKILHTLIWIFYNIVIFYALYAVVFNKIDRWLWWSLVLIGIECAVLLFFRMVCPLTLVARRYSDSQKDNFDIFLPNWLAKYNKHIYGSLLVLALVILLWRLS